MGNRDYGKKSSVVKMADGGDVGMDRAMPVADSAKTDGTMSLFERMRLGNKDQAGSEAYNTIGAGRDATNANSDKRMMRAGSDDSAAAPAPSSSDSSDNASPDTSDYGSDTGRGAPGTSETTTAAPSPSPKPRARRVIAQPSPSSGGFAAGVASGIKTGMDAIPTDGKYERMADGGVVCGAKHYGKK